MTICTLASSSSGNSTIVSQGKTHLLIDAGISLRRIKEGLKAFDLTPDDLAGVLITHEHSDHVKGLEMLAKYHGISIFSSVGAGHGIYYAKPHLEPYINGFEIGVSFELGDIVVTSFNIPHDACQSVGFCVQAGGKTLAYATDLGYVTQEVMDAMRGADIAFVESNHDKMMLKSGPYPAHLKKRVASKHGHLSNNDCGSFAVELVKSGTQYLQLSHLSRENNTPELAKKTEGQAMTDVGISIDKNVKLDVAMPFSPSKIYEI
jgi:phosphoribosyl 1,2-cyclic phosphodiesterase